MYGGAVLNNIYTMWLFIIGTKYKYKYVFWDSILKLLLFIYILLVGIYTS